MPRFSARLLPLFVVSGCVIGRPVRQSRSEAAQGPLAPSVTGSPVVPTTTASNEDSAPEKAKPGAVWVSGYWHWDGVRYVWQRGRWETTSASAGNSSE